MHVQAQPHPGLASAAATACSAARSWRCIVSVLMHTCVLLYVTEASFLQPRPCRTGCAPVRHAELKDKLRHARTLLLSNKDDGTSTAADVLQEAYDAAWRITDVALQQVLHSFEHEVTTSSSASGSNAANSDVTQTADVPAPRTGQADVFDTSGSQISMLQASHMAQPQHVTPQSAATTQAAVMQAAARQQQAMTSTSKGLTSGIVPWTQQQQLPQDVQQSNAYTIQTASSDTKTLQTAELPVVTSAGSGGITISTSTPINIVNPIQSQQTGFGSGSLLEAFLRRPRIIVVPVFLGR